MKDALVVPRMEYKIAAMDLKATTTDNSGRVRVKGHFSVFDNMDDGGDIITPGAFNKTIKEQGHRVKILYQHDPAKIIGGKPEILAEDQKGLYAEGDILTKTFWGNEAAILLQEGAINEGSIGYMSVPDKTEWRTNGDMMARVLHEVKLFEVSPVPWGMNPLTDVEAVKAMWDSLRPGLRPSEVQAKMADEYLTALIRITHDIKAGRVLSSANVARAKDARSALQDAISLLEELIQAAEPNDGKASHSALDPNTLKARLDDLDARMGKYVATIL